MKTLGVYAMVDVSKRDASIISNIVHSCWDALVEDYPHSFIAPRDYHATFLYSEAGDYREIEPKSGQYQAKIKDIEVWDTHDKCVVLILSSPSLEERHKQLMDLHKLEWDYPHYIPHITICYDIQPKKEPLSNLKDKLVGRSLVLVNEQIEALAKDHSDI
jgi:hypothetical protein